MKDIASLLETRPRISESNENCENLLRELDVFREEITEALEFEEVLTSERTQRYTVALNILFLLAAFAQISQLAVMLSTTTDISWTTLLVTVAIFSIPCISLLVYLLRRR